jgi:hypothetical protein
MPHYHYCYFSFAAKRHRVLIFQHAVILGLYTIPETCCRNVRNGLRNTFDAVLTDIPSTHAANLF